MPTVNILGVELMSAGTWDASTGRITVTPDDFACMVTAYKDQLVDQAPIKLGHDDSRFQDAQGNPPKGDGGPAYGWIENLTTSPDGTRLIGDFMGVPAGLAEIIPAAFRRRSVEVAWGVRTGAGKTYRAVLTGIALLGQQAPAVKGLADILALYSAGHVIESSGYIVQESPWKFSGNSDTPNVHQLPAPIAHGEPEATPTIIGGSMPYPKGLLALLGLTESATEAEVETAIAAAKLADPATGTPAAPTAVPAAPAALAPVLPLVPAAPASPAAPVAAPLGGEQVAAGAAGVALVTLSAAQYAELQTAGAAGVEALRVQAAERRDRVVHMAFSQGRIHKDDIPDYRARLETDEAGMTVLLAKLQPVFHVQPEGSATAQPVYGSSTSFAAGELSPSDKALVDQARRELGMDVA